MLVDLVAIPRAAEYFYLTVMLRLQSVNSAVQKGLKMSLDFPPYF